MGLASTAFSIACTAALAVTMLGALMRTAGLHVFGVAAFVFVMFWISRGVSATVPPPWSLAHYPLQDVTLIAMLAWTWGPTRPVWKIAVMFLLLLQLGFHAAYWAVYLADAASVRTLRGYILLNNIALAGILLALGGTGVMHVAVGARDLHRSRDLLWRGGVDQHPRGV